MCTGNLMSMIYPLSVLLYALLEDPRPRSTYWSIVLIYAEFVILFKFLIQQNALTVLTPGSLFVEIMDKYKLGFRVFDKKEYATGIFGFIIWDILVALSVLLHQHCLVLMGLWKKREIDIETMDEAKRRINLHIQRVRYEQRLKEIKKNEEIKRLETIYNEDEDDTSALEMKIPKLSVIKECETPNSSNDKTPGGSIKKRIRRNKSEAILNTSSKLELSEDSSPEYVKKKTVLNFGTKTLEELSIDEDEDLDKVVYSANYFIHDYSEDTKNGSVTSCQPRIRVNDHENYSEIDYEEYCMSENNMKGYDGLDDEAIIALQNDMKVSYNKENEFLNQSNNPLSLKQLVLKNQFLNSLFPQSKNEKPGVDMYNAGAIVQFLIIAYILFFFSQMTGEKEELSETFKFKRFRTEMILFMFIQIMLILLDRFFYISNIFEKENKPEDDETETESSSDEENKPSIFRAIIESDHKQSFFKLLIYITLVLLVNFV